MLTRLLILWLLSEQSLHGYAIKRTLDDQAMRFWFSLDYGSVYAVLRTLEREGFVEPAGEEQEGSRPVRRRYAITKGGRAALRKLLREAWIRLPVSGEPVDLALAAISELDEDDIGPLLDERAAALTRRLEKLRSLARSAPSPELVARHEALVEAELAWVRSYRRRRSIKPGRRNSHAAPHRRATDRQSGGAAT